MVSFTNTIYNIPATPLHSLRWSKDLGRVDIEFRPGTSTEDKRAFVFDLLNSLRGLEIDG